MSEEQEEWRPVVGYEGLYEVSNLGRVRNSRTLYVLNGSKRGSYLQVCLRRTDENGVSVKTGLNVHRLVALAFIQNPDCKPVVDHIDGNALNNVVSNLRWVTQRENVLNPITAARQREACLRPYMLAKTRRNFHSPEAIAKRKITIRRPDVYERINAHKNRPVRCIDTGEIFESVSAAAIAFCCSPAAISASCRLTIRGRKKTGTHKGRKSMHFEYYKPNNTNQGEGT